MIANAQATTSKSTNLFGHKDKIIGRIKKLVLKKMFTRAHYYVFGRVTFSFGSCLSLFFFYISDSPHRKIYKEKIKW